MVVPMTAVMTKKNVGVNSMCGTKVARTIVAHGSWTRSAVTG
jgi:hypothetical protein